MPFNLQEFVRRFPVLVPFHSLKVDTLTRILTEPKNDLVCQYKELLAMDKATLQFTDGALNVIAKLAMERQTGARELRSIIENQMFFSFPFFMCKCYIFFVGIYLGKNAIGCDV